MAVGDAEMAAVLLDGILEMLFHGSGGDSENLGYLAVCHALDAAHVEDVPRTLRQEIREIQNVRYVRQLLNFFSGDVALVSEIGSRDYFPCRQWQFIKSYCRIFFLVPADDIVTFVPYGLEKVCRNLVRTDFNPLVEKCAKDIVKNVFGIVRGRALSSASG